MPDLLTALDAFVQEHRRSGELDGGIDGLWVWMSGEWAAERRPHLWSLADRAMVQSCPSAGRSCRQALGPRFRSRCY